MSEKEKLLAELDRCVLEMEDEAVVDVAKEYVAAGHDAYDGITEGLSRGMEKAGKLYEEEEYFVPELLICSDAMYNGLDVLKPHLKLETTSDKIKVVIGVVEGDTHDIGKNLVRIMSESAGFEIYDLGRDVPLDEFIRVAEENECDFICMSTLMTTTMEGMKIVIDKLKEQNIRHKYKVMIGGGPISQKFADEIGADAYTVDAAAAVKRMKELKGVS